MKNFNWKLNFAKLEEIIQSLSAKLCEADGRQAAEISSGGYSKQKETSSPDSGSEQTCVKLIPNEKLIPTVIFIRIENEEDFNIIMDKIPEYGVVDEEVIQTLLAMLVYKHPFQEEETLQQIEMLKTTMRQYRLKKKELYEEAKAPKTTEEM